MTTRYSEKCFTVKAQKLWLSERKTNSKTAFERTRNSERVPVPDVRQGPKADGCLIFDKFGEGATVTKPVTITNQGKKRGRQINGTFYPASCRYEDHRYTRAQSASYRPPLTVHAVGYNVEPRVRSRSFTHPNHGPNKADIQAISSLTSKPFYQTARLSSSLTNISKISTAKDLNSVLHVSHCQLSSRWAIDTGAITRLRETLIKRRARTALPTAGRVKLEPSSDHIARDNRGQSEASEAQVEHGPCTGELPAESEAECGSPDVERAEGELPTPSEKCEADEGETDNNSIEDTLIVPTAEFVDFSDSLNMDEYKERPRSVGFCRRCEKDSSSTEVKQCHPEELKDKFRRFLRPTLTAGSLPQMVVYQWEAKQTDSDRPKVRRRSHTAPTPSLQRMYKRVIEIDLRGIPRCTSSEMPGTPPGSPRTGYHDPWGERMWRLDAQKT